MTFLTGILVQVYSYCSHCVVIPDYATATFWRNWNIYIAENV